MIILKTKLYFSRSDGNKSFPSDLKDLILEPFVVGGLQFFINNVVIIV